MTSLLERYIAQFNGIKKNSPMFYTESISTVIALANIVGADDIVDKCKELLGRMYKGTTLEYCQEYVHYCGLNYAASTSVQDTTGNETGVIRLPGVRRFLTKIQCETIGLFTRVIRQLEFHDDQIEDHNRKP